MYPPLPIDPVLPDIVRAIRRCANVVLTATPGAGKTTRLPPELLDCVPGHILVLQPRRLAAVAAAGRVCVERGWTLGEVVGYQVRFESKVSARTRLTFMTDATLLRRLIDDPELNGVDLVVLDEFHERTLNQDLILGLLLELQQMGRAIKVVIMSATLDVPRTLRYLGDAEHVDVPGQVHPLEIFYSDDASRARTDRDFFDRLDRVVRRAAGGDGDVLVFLPGVGEISRLSDRLTEGVRLDREVVALHGSLNLKDQQRVLRPSERPRVILSTNVAEASVTVPGVTCVVDSGLAKVTSVNPRSGFTSLNLVRISLFNARQRAGRAARERAGRCFRMWTEFEDRTLAVEPAPEVTREDLSQAILLLAHFGVTEFTKFSWFDAPPPALVDWAVRTLRTLGALDDARRLTARGRELIRFPLPPRWGGLLAAGGGRVFARAAAILNERDFADRLEITTPLECDVTLRLELLDDLDRGRRPGGINARGADAVLDVARQLERLAPRTRGDVNELRRHLLLTQRDRLCRRRGTGGRGVMVGGRGVRLEPSSQVKGSEFFVALSGVDLPGDADTTIRIASGFSKDDVLRELKNEIEIENDVYLDEARGAFMSRRRRRFGDLELDEPTVTPVPAAELGDRLSVAMVDRWDWLVGRHEGLAAWVARWDFLRRLAPEYDEHLDADRRRDFMTAVTTGRSSLAQVLAADLIGTLEGLLPPAVARVVRTEVPSQFTAPSGVAHRISYEGENGAFVDVRLQEMFGLAAAPKLVFGRVPLAFRLLGPNYRPVQVTADLANFWRTGYAEVRKQLRARYPKHSWPDDPLTARPEAKGTRRR